MADNLSRVEAALVVLARLLPERPAALPIFLRLEWERDQLRDNPFARAKAMAGVA